MTSNAETTVDAPAAPPPAPEGGPPCGPWQVDPASSVKFAPTSNGVVVQITFLGPKTVEAAIEAVARESDAYVSAALRQEMLAHPASQRLFGLAADAAELRRRREQLAARHRVLQAQRDEATTVAAPGVGQRLVGINADLAAVGRELAAVDEAIATLEAPTQAARQEILRGLTRRKEQLNDEAARAALARREEAARGLCPPQMWKPLVEWLGAARAGWVAVQVRSLGGDPQALLAAVENAGAEEARAAGPTTPAPQATPRPPEPARQTADRPAEDAAGKRHQEAEGNGGPAAAHAARFLAQQCVTGPEQRAPVEDVWGEWERFCADYGHEPGGPQSLGRALAALVPDLRVERPRTESGGRQRVYAGLALRPGSAK
jgi:hypothetical protein